MAEKLTPQQQEAVNDRGGKLLVSAAAGSGKTKVLVDRLLKYMKDPVLPANIDEFLIITYTKAAASELRSKIAAKLSEHIAQEPENRHLQRQLQRLYLTKISTVHSFCSDILRDYAYLLDISGDFRVADENEITQIRDRAMLQILEEAYNTIDSNSDLQAFVDTQGMGRNDDLVPQIILQVYNSAMCHIDPRAWCNKCLSDSNLDGIKDPCCTVWGRYLTDDLFTFLDEQIKAMEQGASQVAAIPGQEKPAALLRDTVNQLKHLRKGETWDEICARKDIDFGRLVFSKKTDDPLITLPIKTLRKACKDQLAKKLRYFSAPAWQVMGDLSKSAGAARGLMALVERFWQRFSTMKRQRRVLDFSDLEHKTLDLLLGKNRSGPTSAAKEIGKRFREIMVDEYQDSNGVQDAIFSAMSGSRNNLFMVGDVKQSIYQFRLADPGIFLRKYNTYVDASVAQPGQGRKVLLSANFRSGTGVIEAANFVFSNCMSKAVGSIDYGEAEALREGIPHIPIGEPEVEFYAIRVSKDTYAEESAFVADRICQLLDGTHFVRQGDTLRPIHPEDIVILLRSPGSVGIDFMNALVSRGVRCASSAGSNLLIEPEVSTLRCLLQVISNPRQDIPLLAVLASPVFGFTAEDLALLRCENRNCCIYESLKSSGTSKAVAFMNCLSVLRKKAAMGTLPELFERIFNLTRLDTIYSAGKNGAAAKDNLQEFYQYASDFSCNGGDLERFLSHLEALEKKGLTSSVEDSTAGCVTIMSIHKSKGLEFPVVFLCGLSKSFNTDDLHRQVLCHKEMGLGLSYVDEDTRVRYPTLSKAGIAAKMTADNISEEMRVLYVAMTRPKDRLIMTYASASLDKDVTDTALLMDLCSREALTKDVNCAGRWILYSALKRSEAGELFAIAEKPKSTAVSELPWHIHVLDGFSETTAQSLGKQTDSQPLPESILDAVRQGLNFRYSHKAATETPSKQTATQLKGRLKDDEAAEHTHAKIVKQRVWRRPTFVVPAKDPTARGTAVHTVLQHIPFNTCGDIHSVRDAIHSLVSKGFLSQQDAELVNPKAIADFFATDIGKRVRTGVNVLREFKFSVLEDASTFINDLSGEKVLLQGVVDCALVENDSITVIDFKTDYVTEETLDALTEHYSPQIRTYARALERIFKLPVKEMCLYFFGLHRFSWISK